MHSTGFWADAAELPTCYQVTADGVRVFDPPGGLFSRPPAFESVGGGLVSTVPDYLAFLAAIADGTLLPHELKTMMTTDQLTDEQREGIDEMDGGGTSWGLGFGIDLARTDPWTAPGRYGWTGGLGTSAYVNPGSDLIGIVFTQRMMSGPGDKFEFFWGPVADSVATPH
jgi:CubicO group peptidase (beta-lactamase class C family)